MEQALSSARMLSGDDDRLVEAIDRERGRLRNFIRRRVPNDADAEDILHDVFYELIEAYRLLQPIEQVGAWLMRVARNRIVDRFRKRQPQTFSSLAQPANQDAEDEGSHLSIEELLPSADGGPEAAYTRSILLDELDAALDELPEGQREVFIAHELEGISFKQLAAHAGVSVNTLLSQKHRAVVHLRRRLQSIYEEFLQP